MNVDRINKFRSADQSRIEGWFFDLDQIAFFELFQLQNQLLQRPDLTHPIGDIAEIGVFHGKSLVYLSLLKRSKERLFGFDLFAEDHLDKTNGNLREYGDNENTRLIEGLTTEIAREDLDNMLSTPLRFLHIDAGHEYHEVLEQLLLFSPYVLQQGIIAMDDYQDREFPGIEAAVLDFCEIDRPRRFVPFLSGGNKMFLCLEHMSVLFQQRLVQRPNFENSSRLTRVRDFNILVMRSKLPVPADNILSQLLGSAFPRRSDDDLSLNQKSSSFSQLTFGSGVSRD